MLSYFKINLIFNIKFCVLPLHKKFQGRPLIILRDYYLIYLMHADMGQL